MKTATVPNSPELNELIETSTEVSLALERLEQLTRTGAYNAMVDGVQHGMLVLDVRSEGLVDFTPKQLQLVKASMATAIQYAVDYTVANVIVHENHIGLTSESAPGKCVKDAAAQFHGYTKTLWEEVSS